MNYAEKKEKHICVWCKNKAIDGHVFCEKCLLKKRKYVNQTRQFYRDLGLCPRCGKNRLFGDERNCSECSAKNYEDYIKNEQKIKQRKSLYHSKYVKNVYHERINNGICYRCGKRKCDGGYKSCGICRAKTRESRRIKRGINDRSRRFEQGICYFCNSPLKEGYKVCEKHYLLNVENAQKTNRKNPSFDFKYGRNLYGK